MGETHYLIIYISHYYGNLCSLTATQHLPPVLSPRVPHDPKHAILRVGAPSNHGHDVVNALALRLDDAGFIVEQGVGVNAAGDGTTMEDLL